MALEGDSTLSGRADRSPAPKEGLFARLGPGLITGAADDDPSGIGTYAQIGAGYGYAMGWTLVFSFPLMSAIQEISARIGRATGRGLGGNLRLHFPAWLGWCLVLGLLAANVINLAADLAAMGAALSLVVGGPDKIYAVGFAALCAALQIWVSYPRYVAFLKWLTLSLLVYPAVAFVAKVNWGAAAHGLVVPNLEGGADAAMALVAVLGTTISPYLFFWQAAQEQEEQRVSVEAKPLKVAPEQAPLELARIRADTIIGMLVSNVIAIFIMITIAATLHAAGRTHIETSAQAAEALKPLAGEGAFLLFALGIVSTGLLAVPVLAGSASHALGELLRWRVGLARPPEGAKRFYLAIAVVTVASAGLVFLPVDPFEALYLSAVINGVMAPPVMITMMLLARRRDVMGPARIGTLLLVLGWLATLVMAGAVIMMGATALWGG
jgi:NRAMP (natural resistance-associated macrophage protein)-like metal ion transporter